MGYDGGKGGARALGAVFSGVGNGGQPRDLLEEALRVKTAEASMPRKICK